MGAAAAILPAIIGAGANLGMYFLQRHDAATAHQTEVQDLMKAGINPLMTAQTRGAPVQQAPNVGADIQAGLNTGLALRQAQLERDRIAAQTRRLNVTTDDLLTQAASGRYEIIRNQADQGLIAADQARALMPILIEKARAEVLASTSSAANSAALAELNKAALTGVLNQQQLDKMVGAGGPALELLLEIVRGITPAVRAVR